MPLTKSSSRPSRKMDLMFSLPSQAIREKGPILRIKRRGGRKRKIKTLSRVSRKFKLAKKKKKSIKCWACPHVRLLSLKKNRKSSK